VRTIGIGEEGRESSNPRRTEMDITIRLDSIEEHISSFFLVMTADSQHTTLEDLENVSCSTRNAEAGTAIALYNVQMDTPSTAMMITRLVKTDMRSRQSVTINKTVNEMRWCGAMAVVTAVIYMECMYEL
jgi:hypothetical protein